MIDHENFDRASTRLQLQPELLLKGCEQRRTRIDWRTLAGIWVRRQFGRPREIVVDESCNVGSVNHDAVKEH